MPVALDAGEHGAQHRKRRERGGVETRLGIEEPKGTTARDTSGTKLPAGGAEPSDAELRRLGRHDPRQEKTEREDDGASHSGTLEGEREEIRDAEPRRPDGRQRIGRTDQEPREG